MHAVFLQPSFVQTATEVDNNNIPGPGLLWPKSAILRQTKPVLTLTIQGFKVKKMHLSQVARLESSTGFPDIHRTYIHTTYIRKRPQKEAVLVTRMITIYMLSKIY